MHPLVRVEQEGFVVVGKIEGRVWSQQDAATFYSEHRGKAFFETLVDFMSSGPIVQLCLEKVKATRQVDLFDFAPLISFKENQDVSA